MTSWDPYGELAAPPAARRAQIQADAGTARGGRSALALRQPGGIYAPRPDDAAAVAGIAAALERHGPAPGGRKMMDWEAEAAELAVATGVYVVWRNAETGQDCSRVGPASRCFCGHVMAGHRGLKTCGDAGCRCPRFEFIPQRPEEVGDWWLPRRRGFDVRAWRAQCKCRHGHDAHDPTAGRRCRIPGCGCASFCGGYACVACDGTHEAHETISESGAERSAAGRPVGDAFRPLASTPAIQRMVFRDSSPGLSLDWRPGVALPHRTEAETLARLGGRGLAGDSPGTLVSPWQPGGPGAGRGVRPAHQAAAERSVALSRRDQGGLGLGRG